MRTSRNAPFLAPDMVALLVSIMYMHTQDMLKSQAVADLS
jgi:hypothetical protein